MNHIANTISAALGSMAEDLLKVVFLAIVAALGKAVVEIGNAITAFAQNKSDEQKAKATLADHETKKTISKDVAVAMEQSPDFVSNQEMKQGAVNLLKEKMPNESNAAINAYAELGVVEKKKNDTSEASVPNVDLSITTPCEPT